MIMEKIQGQMLQEAQQKEANPGQQLRPKKPVTVGT